jgi:hypothetical protein
VVGRGPRRYAGPRRGARLLLARADPRLRLGVLRLHRGAGAQDGEEPRARRRHTDDLAALLAHGATVLRPKGDQGLGWSVLADPDGNEFCAFTD